jgi:hypothetical protein
MEKLIQIQTELKAPKNQRNNFGNYNYRSAEDILEAVKPLLKVYNCLLYLTDTIECIGGRNYVKATATFIDNDWTLSVSASAREEETKKGMDGSQITGAASSYARKYALNGLFLIDDNKDSDFTNTHDKEQKTQPKEQSKPESKGVPFDRMLENYQTWVEWFAKNPKEEADKLNEMRTKYKFIIDFTDETELINDANKLKLTLNKK